MKTKLAILSLLAIAFCAFGCSDGSSAPSASKKLPDTKSGDASGGTVIDRDPEGNK
jgi:hypothetical protein